MSLVSGFNTEREGVNADKDDIGEKLVTRGNTALYSNMVAKSLIRVDTLRGFLAEVLQELLNLGDTSRTTDEDNLQHYLALIETRDMTDIPY